MEIPSSNPFERAADAWRAEVDAEAARLLNAGVASNPGEAQRMAEQNVSVKRRACASQEALTKAFPRFKDGPFSGSMPVVKP